MDERERERARVSKGLSSASILMFRLQVLEFEERQDKSREMEKKNFAEHKN